MPIDFSKYKQKETSESKTSDKTHTILEPIKEETISEPINIKEEKKIASKTPKKDILLKDLEYILDKSGYKVIIELNEKTPTRLKSGILQANKIKGYGNMKNEQLNNEISKLIANNILKTLKGSENNE